MSHATAGPATGGTVWLKPDGGRPWLRDRVVTETTGGGTGRPQRVTRNGLGYFPDFFPQVPGAAWLLVMLFCHCANVPTGRSAFLLQL